MKIRHLTIEHFRAIDCLDIDCSDSVNAFIGDNGAGKSTVLDAIVLLYSWLNARFSSPRSRGRNIQKDDLRAGAEYCFLSIEVEHEGMTAQWSLLKGRVPKDASGKRTDLSRLDSLVRHIREHGENEQYMFSVYGVNRNISSITVNKQLYGKKGAKGGAVSNTFASTSWKPFFNWYFERENEENRMKARFNSQYHDESLDTIRECLQEVFPDYRNLRVEDRPTRFVIEKDRVEINFERLSDGEKCYITLVLDIARRLSMQNDGTNPILKGEQVVLIDELDLHLHPSWQLQVVSNLERKFPNCQFFVTSHSPLVLSSLGEQDKLVVLRDGGELILSDIPYGDNGDYILKRFFGLKAVRNPEVQQKIDSIADELGKKHPNLEYIEKSLNELSMRGVQFDEAVRMHLLLAQKKKAHA
jgi:predicted ATP-binding protein involved in virulence